MARTESIAPPQAAVPSDNPIRRAEQDVLGRLSVAQSFVKQVLTLDSSEGIVVGVLGPWGSGKTSFLNLTRIEFKQTDVPVIDFNPWMFSGTEQLVESFFVEVAAQLKMRPQLVEVGDALEEYAETFSGMSWLPLLGPWIERARGAAKVLVKILQRRKQGIGARRDRIRQALRRLQKPIIIVLDDIDRLSTVEIQNVFKLVRLTASFPRVIYLVAFDRTRVEKALEEQGLPGRGYLEKIIQLVIDLPLIPSHVLNQQIYSAVEAAISNVESVGDFDGQAWPDVFMEILRPLIRNMRDVRRYAAAIHGTVRALNGQVALVDVLALEAIRVFLPDVFSELPAAIDGLTSVSELSVRTKDTQLKAQIDRLISLAETHEKIIRALIDRMFPAAQRYIGNYHYGPEWKGGWLKGRRAAHETILRLYLERVTGEELKAFTDAEHAFTKMSDGAEFEAFLRSIDSTHVQDVVASLETFQDDFAAEQVIPATTVLFNLLPDLPERPRPLFGIDTSVVITRVTYRLLRSLKDPVTTETAVRQILPNLSSLSSKLGLIEQVGHRNGIGHKLIPEDAAKELEGKWRVEVRSASVTDFVKEWNLFRVLYLAKHDADSSEPTLNLAYTPELTLAILRNAQTEVLGQGLGGRAVSRSARLPWNLLIKLYGDEEALKTQIVNLRAACTEDGEESLTLAEKYAGGWRPDDFRELNT